MSNFEMLFLLMMVPAIPTTCFVILGCFRRAKGIPKDRIFNPYSITTIAEMFSLSAAAMFVIFPLVIPDPLSDSIRWTLSSLLLASFLGWRVYGMSRRNDAEPWSRFAEAGTERFILAGSIAVGVLQLVNAAILRDFAPCLLGVLWLPLVSVVGLSSMRINSQP